MARGKDAGTPAGLFLEDLEPGATYETVERLVTQEDITGFANLTGDHNPLHTDPEYCKGTVYGVPIAHGLLVFGIFTGLYHQLGIFSGTALAFLGIDGWQFRRAVLVGDRVRGRITIVDARPTRSDPTRGVVTRRCEVLNQRDEIVQEGTTTVMVRRRSVAPSPSAS